MEALRFTGCFLLLVGCQELEVQGGADPAPEGEEGEGEAPAEGEGEGEGQAPAEGEGEGGGEGEGEGEGQARWSALLAEVVGDGCLAYGPLQAGDLAAELDAVLAWVADTDPEALSGAAARRAFWINAYNVLTVGGVVEGLRETDSFSTAGADLNTFTFFSSTQRPVAGGELTLDEIEHSILRGVEGAPAALVAHHEAAFPEGEVFDARIHAALNCGARSCPAIAPFAFTGDQLDAQLDARTTLWLDDPVRGAGPDGISSLFNWFGPDFVAYAGSVDEFIAPRRTDGLDGVPTGVFLEYDWRLNGCD